MKVEIKKALYTDGGGKSGNGDSVGILPDS